MREHNFLRLLSHENFAFLPQRPVLTFLRFTSRTLSHTKNLAFLSQEPVLTPRFKTLLQDTIFETHFKDSFFRKNLSAFKDPFLRLFSTSSLNENIWLLASTGPVLTPCLRLTSTLSHLALRISPDIFERLTSKDSSSHKNCFLAERGIT